MSQDESRRSTPPIPPGFEAQVLNESRRSTPTVPPGLTKPNVLPDLDGGALSRPTSRPSSRASLRRTTSQILPAIPLRPGTPAKRGQQDEAKAQPLETPTKAPSVTSSDAKATISAKLSKTKSKSSIEEEDAMGKTAEKALQDDTTVVPDSPTPTVSKKKSTTNDRLGNDDESSKASSSKHDYSENKSPKRKHPGKLDITAATGKQGTVASATPAIHDVDTPNKPYHIQAAPTKPSDSPAASPVMKTAPRTLRLVKTDATPSTPVTASPLPPTMINRVPSRQPSVASIQVPGTPSSEQVSMSDNISMASTSQSRANSPPPSKVGSAPLRAKTKNQLKKERQERAKALEEEKAKTEEAVKAPVEEPLAQEAIVSRKKKAKKEKEPKVKAKASPPVVEAKPVVAQVQTSPAKATPKDVPKPEVTQKDTKTSKPATPTKIPIGPQPPPQSPMGPSPPPTPTATAAQLIAELKASAPEIQKCIDSLFRVSNSNYFKPNQNITAKDLANPANWRSDIKVNLSKSEVDALLNGVTSGIHYGGEDGRMWDRGVITPSGAHLRALTKELESRFLELEKALREMPDEFRFRSSKPQNDMKFPSIDLEALKRQFENAGSRGVSVMEQMVQDGASMKKGAFLVDEASKYINEFIMPPATPPPSSGSGGGHGGGSGASRAQQQASSGSHSNGSSNNHSSSAEVTSAAPSVEIAERRLNEAKRMAEERETALKKIIKKNKRILGLS